ncbi:hypothetical protein QE410_000505 [Microbacterium sp. SORGH_AS 1204]|uniref:hypothetical protein n=1 Tax=Microbacterium sp. SORGH_AS_1204 TaxID=3041785 RepID=UPI002791F8B4|nr:hypothetical protein [Microbacterium sp. SORGH_AS_1204]MDQ1135706.1 hypothetical protein [Microbacterium sp. SORGH_AS_1204]
MKRLSMHLRRSRRLRAAPTVDEAGPLDRAPLDGAPATTDAPGTYDAPTVGR